MHGGTARPKEARSGMSISYQQRSGGDDPGELTFFRAEDSSGGDQYAGEGGPTGVQTLCAGDGPVAGGLAQ